jgi:hypothetical protein
VAGSSSAAAGAGAHAATGAAAGAAAGRRTTFRTTSKHATLTVRCPATYTADDIRRIALEAAGVVLFSVHLNDGRPDVDTAGAAGTAGADGDGPGSADAGGKPAGKGFKFAPPRSRPSASHKFGVVRVDTRRLQGTATLAEAMARLAAVEYIDAGAGSGAAGGAAGGAGTGSGSGAAGGAGADSARAAVDAEAEVGAAGPAAAAAAAAGGAGEGSEGSAFPSPASLPSSAYTPPGGPPYDSRTSPMLSVVCPADWTPERIRAEARVCGARIFSVSTGVPVPVPPRPAGYGGPLRRTVWKPTAGAAASGAGSAAADASSASVAAAAAAAVGAAAAPSVAAEPRAAASLPAAAAASAPAASVVVAEYKALLDRSVPLGARETAYGRLVGQRHEVLGPGGSIMPLGPRDRGILRIRCPAGWGVDDVKAFGEGLGTPFYSAQLVGRATVGVSASDGTAAGAAAGAGAGAPTAAAAGGAVDSGADAAARAVAAIAAFAQGLRGDAGAPTAGASAAKPAAPGAAPASASAAATTAASAASAAVTGFPFGAPAPWNPAPPPPMQRATVRLDFGGGPERVMGWVHHLHALRTPHLRFFAARPAHPAAMAAAADAALAAACWGGDAPALIYGPVAVEAASAYLAAAAALAAAEEGKAKLQHAAALAVKVAPAAAAIAAARERAGIGRFPATDPRLSVVTVTIVCSIGVRGRAAGGPAGAAGAGGAGGEAAARVAVSAVRSALQQRAASVGGLLFPDPATAHLMQGSWRHHIAGQLAGVARAAALSAGLAHVVAAAEATEHAAAASGTGGAAGAPIVAADAIQGASAGSPLATVVATLHAPSPTAPHGLLFLSGPAAPLHAAAEWARRLLAPGSGLARHSFRLPPELAVEGPLQTVLARQLLAPRIAAAAGAAGKAGGAAGAEDEDEASSLDACGGGGADAASLDGAQPWWHESLGVDWPDRGRELTVAWFAGASVGEEGTGGGAAGAAGAAGTNGSAAAGGAAAGTAGESERRSAPPRVVRALLAIEREQAHPAAAGADRAAGAAAGGAVVTTVDWEPPSAGFPAGPAWKPIAAVLARDYALLLAAACERSRGNIRMVGARSAVAAAAAFADSLAAGRVGLSVAQRKGLPETVAAVQFDECPRLARLLRLNLRLSHELQSVGAAALRFLTNPTARTAAGAAALAAAQGGPAAGCGRLRILPLLKWSPEHCEVLRLGGAPAALRPAVAAAHTQLRSIAARCKAISVPLSGAEAAWLARHEVAVKDLALRHRVVIDLPAGGGGSGGGSGGGAARTVGGAAAATVFGFAVDLDKAQTALMQLLDTQPRDRDAAPRAAARVEADAQGTQPPGTQPSGTHAAGMGAAGDGGAGFPYGEEAHGHGYEGHAGQTAHGYGGHTQGHAARGYGHYMGQTGVPIHGGYAAAEEPAPHYASGDLHSAGGYPPPEGRPHAYTFPHPYTGVGVGAFGYSQPHPGPAGSPTWSHDPVAAADDSLSGAGDHSDVLAARSAAHAAAAAVFADEHEPSHAAASVGPTAPGEDECEGEEAEAFVASAAGRFADGEEEQEAEAEPGPQTASHTTSQGAGEPTAPAASPAARDMARAPAAAAAGTAIEPGQQVMPSQAAAGAAGASPERSYAQTNASRGASPAGIVTRMHSQPLSLAGLPGLAPLLVAQARSELGQQLAALGAELVYDAAVAPRELVVAGPSAYALEVGEHIVQQWLGRQAAVRQAAAASPGPGLVYSASAQALASASASPPPQRNGGAASPAVFATAASPATLASAAAPASTRASPAQQPSPSPSPSRGVPGAASQPPPGLAGLPGRAAFSRLALGAPGGADGSHSLGTTGSAGSSFSDPYAEPYSAFSGPRYSDMAAVAGGFAPVDVFAIAPASAPAVAALAPAAQPMLHADTADASRDGEAGSLR